MAGGNLFATNRRSSIRIPLSGEHHRELLGLIDLFGEGVRNGRTREALNLILLRFIDYAIYHFRKDAELIEKYGYGDYLVQYKMEQQAFVRELDGLRGKTRLPSFMADEKTVDALKRVFSRHIDSVDKYLVKRPDSESGDGNGSRATA